MKKSTSFNYNSFPLVSRMKIKKEASNEKKISRIITIILIIIMVFIMLFCGYSMAKVVDNVLIKGNTGIAEPILVVENNPVIDITEVNNEGIYTFKIKNYNEQDKITEANLKYYIEIIGDSNNSLNMQLFQGENEIELINHKTEYMELSKNQKQDIEYKIKFFFDKNSIGSVNDILDNIQIKVHSEQVKA